MRKTKAIFIQNLRRGRKSKRLTQAEFAEAVDMSLRGYQKYEQGESAPTPEVLERFAEHIGCEPWELVSPAAGPSGDEARLLALFRRLSPKGRTVALSQIEALVTLHEDKVRAAR